MQLTNTKFTTLSSHLKARTHAHKTYSFFALNLKLEAARHSSGENCSKYTHSSTCFNRRIQTKATIFKGHRELQRVTNKQEQTQILTSWLLSETLGPGQHRECGNKDFSNMKIQCTLIFETKPTCQVSSNYGLFCHPHYQSLSPDFES